MPCFFFFTFTTLSLLSSSYIALMCDWCSLLSFIVDTELLRCQYRETMPPFECPSTGHSGSPDRIYSQHTKGSVADRWVWELCKNYNQHSWGWIIHGEWREAGMQVWLRSFLFWDKVSKCSLHQQRNHGLLCFHKMCFHFCSFSSIVFVLFKATFN